MLTTAVARALRGPCAVVPGSRLLVAVSGGPDSMALLHLLHELAASYTLELHVAHFHHRLRGTDADEDARFVRESSARLGLPVTTGEPEEPLLQRGVSPEAAARTARYRFLESVAAEVGASAIAVGHTRDDQAETVLMRLLTGAGPSGLAAMAPRGPRLRVRPLLGIPRARLLAYLAEKGLPHRVDPSNEDPSFLRNRIRTRILPLIEREIRPSVKRTLVREAALFREISEHLDAESQRALERVAHREEGKISLAREGLLSYDRTLRRCMLRAAAREVLRGPDTIALVHVEALLKLLETGSTGSSASLPGGARAVLDRDRLSIVPASEPPRSGWGPVPLLVPGETHLEGAGAVIRSYVEEAASQDPDSAGPVLAFFDMDRLHSPIEARNRRPGDRFVPFGAPGSRKVQDVLVDAHVPRRRRDSVAIVEDAGGILWIAGVKRSARAPVTERTRRILRLEVHAEPVRERTS